MIFFMLLTYLSARVNHALISKRIIDEHFSLSNTLIGVLSSGFFILLAFIIINTWNYQQDARKSALDEANYLAVILFESNELPLESQDKIKKALADYIVSVRTKEWESMRQGHDNQDTKSKLTVLYNSVLSFNPKTDKQKVLYSIMNNTMNSAFEARILRLSKIQSLIPSHLFYTVLWGSIIVSVILGLIRGKDSFVNFSPILLFSALLGFNIALALSFDFPFSGDIVVSNEMYYRGIFEDIKN
jgi:hypothetical protein